jgi:predicted kinase
VAGDGDRAGRLERVLTGQSEGVDAEAMYVVVSGAPGSGKTTIARALAQRLCLPLLSKDTFKEAMMSVLSMPRARPHRDPASATTTTVAATCHTMTYVSSS